MTTRIRRPDVATEDFTTSEGLRQLLTRLHAAGTRAWERDPAAAALVAYAADKYAALARKHGLDPWEAASAAFEVMRSRSAREAVDPWAVITRAVKVSCIAEERGQGLLCSTAQARRKQFSSFHDPERLSDRETPLSDYHPAFHVTDNTDTLDDEDLNNKRADAAAQMVGMTAREAVDACVAMIIGLGWDPDVARASVEHVCAGLARAGSRASAFEAMRRDQHALAFLDIPRTSWNALLRALLGNQNPALCATPEGRGILLRLVVGEPVASIVRDDDLLLSLAMNAPNGRGR